MPGDPASGAPRHRAWIISALGDRFEFVRITDEQAIVIQGDQWTIRPSPGPRPFAEPSSRRNDRPEAPPGLLQLRTNALARLDGAQLVARLDGARLVARLDGARLVARLDGARLVARLDGA